jgi:hypothetical protein
MYKCSRCGRKNIKLWRQYQIICDEKICILHFSGAAQLSIKAGINDQIGTWIPAYPPPSKCFPFLNYKDHKWWRKLPL